MYIEIDARGLACPKPVINTKKELDNIEQGIVIVTVDNDVAKQNILKLSSSLNCESRVIKEEKDLISIEIKKGENVIIEEKKQEELKGFIYTLTESKPYPKSILLVNSGVKLSTENYDTIGNLKILEEAGVEILSCGTCLDYYGLKESLKVGSVTNMYTIVDTMKNSSQTISI